MNLVITRFFEAEYRRIQPCVKNAEQVFESLKEELKAQNTRQLKKDEEEKIKTYYDEAPGSYKQHYLLSLTNRLGMTLKRNGYVTIKKGYEGKEIVKFTWEK